MVGEANNLIDEWCKRFRDNNQAEEEMLQTNEKMRPYERERDEFLNEWRAKFKAMHGAKPIYAIDREA